MDITTCGTVNIFALDNKDSNFGHKIIYCKSTNCEGLFVVAYSVHVDTHTLTVEGEGGEGIDEAPTAETEELQRN